MARGRKFVPPPDREGFWFNHLGADNSGAGTKRTELTSTGDMLTAPFKDTGRPKPPPRPYNVKAQTMYKTVNPFSEHDNRNTIHNREEYWGDVYRPKDAERVGAEMGVEGRGEGRESRLLGRQLLKPLRQCHRHTGQDFLTHHCRQPTLHCYHTEAASSYTGRPTTSPPTRRRFPCQILEPRAELLRPLPTTTTEWYPDTPRSLGSIKASNRVLVLSQKPYMKPNDWKYAYHGLPKVYPTYDPLPGKQPRMEVLPWSSNLHAMARDQSRL